MVKIASDSGTCPPCRAFFRLPQVAMAWEPERDAAVWERVMRLT